MTGNFFRRSAARRGVIAGLSAALLIGCAEVRDKYATPEISIPEPVGAADAPAPSTRPIKPIGARRAAGGPAQRSAIIRTFKASDPAAGAASRRNADPGEDVATLSFVDTDIREVVDVILGQTLGRNYVLDERVQGRVTARTSEPIRRADILPVLQNILAVNGAALIESSGVINVVPVSEAGVLPRVVVTPSSAPLQAGIATYVLPLSYASADSVAEVATGLVSPGNQIVSDPTRNFLIYTGPAAEAQAITDLVSVLDVEALGGKTFGLFPLSNSRADDLASELIDIFFDGQDTGPLRVVPVSRLNALLVVGPRRADIERVRFWIQQLDTTAGGAVRQVYVYHAVSARAEELTAILREVFLGEAASGPPGGAGAVAPDLTPVELIARRATGTEDVASSPAPDAADRLRIVADRRNNAVIVIGTEEEFRLVEATLRQIDIPPLQVLIEATIAEVTLNDDLEYGLQWAFQNGDFRARLSNTSAGNVAPSFPGFNLIFNSADVRVVLSALAEVTNVNVISSPQLMVLDNQSARLQVGDQVPVQVGQTITDGGSQVDAIEYIDTGVILEVTPRVNASGLVTLEVNQQVSDAIATQSSTLNSPTIQQREIQSIVSVQSGQTIALGGLIRQRVAEGDSGVPVLKDAPIIGNLFKTTTQDVDRTELLVLITPRVIRDGADAREVTEELRRRLAGF